MYADNCQTQVPQAAQAVGTSEDAFSDTFESIERFFQRLEIYVEVPRTTSMNDMNEKIMLAVLSILTIVTEGIKTSRASELVEGTHIISHSFLIRKVLEEESGED